METTYIKKVHRQCFPVRLALCFFLFLTASLLYAEDKIHIVENGETVYAMARKYGVKVEDILFLNGINDARKIYPGQKIRIPPNSLMARPISAAEASRGVVEHKTAKGETLIGIARKYGISLDMLLSNNKLPANYRLKTGDVLKIPELLPASTAPAQINQPVPVQLQRVPVLDGAVRWPFTAKESAYISGKLNPGMVLTGEKSETVRSVSSGMVVSAGPYRGFGKVVIVRSDAGYDYFYGGCETISVRKGDRVSPGMEVGKLGVSVLTSKAELTFMVYHNRKSIDPATAPRA